MQQVPRRGTRKRVRAEYAARAHLQVAPMHLRFDRRHVVWLEAVWEELQALPFTSVPITELRRPQFIDTIEDLDRSEQIEWAEDLANRCGHLLVTTYRQTGKLGAMGRTTKVSLAGQAELALGRALGSLGHQVVESPDRDDGNLAITVDGITVPVAIAAASVVDPGRVARMVAATRPTKRAATNLVVGDLITGPAREALRDAGWSWLDRRGHFVLRAQGVHIDADVPADPREAGGAPPRPISGSAGISWATALLMAPKDPPSMREVARRVSLSHSAIVATAKRLKDAALVRADGTPLIPELFWALADDWHSTPTALSGLPTGQTGESDHGWAVAGTVGAAAWGAPVIIGSAYPPDFYLASAADLRRAVHRVGKAERFEERACTVAIPPTPLVCFETFERRADAWGNWRFAHGLFAALDLAQDRSRGAEILDDWNPQDFTRVW